MKKIGLFAIALFVAMGAKAQDGVEDGRYGQGADSVKKCLENISIYTEYVKTSNYQDAYEGWKYVFENHPLAQYATYTNGVKILRALYKEETDADKKAQYSSELMYVYERRLKFLDDLNKIVQNPIPRYEVLGLYAHDYLTVNPKPELQKAYTMLREAVDAGKENTLYYVLADLMKISQQRLKAKKDDDAVREAFLQDYLDCSTYIIPVIEAQTNEKVKEAAEKTKENIDAYFINSGAATCDDLQAIYGPKIEDNKDDLEYLTKVVTLMSMLDCKSSDAYFAAAEYAHAISPTAKTAKSLGALYLSKREDTDKALEFYEQAATLEEDPEAVSDIYYTIAVLWNSKKSIDKCRQYLNKAIQANSKNGNAYILLAQLYASKWEWSGDPVKDKCAFFAVLDKLDTAKRVDSDPAVQKRANELIATYKEHLPASSDLFMLSIKSGDKMEIKGWINETTTIR